LEEDKLWGEIRRMATTDPGMANILDQAKIYYQLKRSP